MNAQSIVSIRHGDCVVTIAPHRGAIVTSFRVGERELLYLDEETFNDPAKNVRGGIPVLFPTPGKLDGDRWHWGGHQGEMKQHGFARNLAWAVQSRGPDSVTLGLRDSESTRSSFPWSFEALLIYKVTAGALRIEFSVTNTGTESMPFAYGLHPYFLVREKERSRVPTQATRAFDNTTKQIVAFTGFDFTRAEVDLHLIDHGSERCAIELDDGARIAIDAPSEFIRWVVWTVGGKDYICVEPWTAPGNALNTREGLIVLEPGTTKSLVVRIALETV